MKKTLLLLVIFGAVAVGWNQFHATPEPSVQSTQAESAIGRAIREQANGVQVTGQGVVTKVLADDTQGSRHQRFIVRLDSGQTLLIAHNIDVAPRVAALESGDRVEFNGVYEWNSKGGVIHWTHHDPAGRHLAGWIRFRGQVFQ